MKDTNKPTKTLLVDTRPLSIPMIKTTTNTSDSTNSSQKNASASIHRITSNGESSNQLALQPTMVSKSTQTEENVTEDLQEKKKLIRKQLAVLIHAVLCRMRDGLIIGITRETPGACSTAFCGLMKNVIVHLRTCSNCHDCVVPHCLSSRQILIHWKSCTESECIICKSFRRIVPEYLQAVMNNSRWREVILNNYRWLLLLLTNDTFPTPPARRQSDPQIRQTLRDQERIFPKNSEE